MRKYGFTLAEVLITLAVIGIVAALTIPTLMQNADERATVTTLKKTYSTLSQAYKLAEQEYGTPDLWGMTSAAGSYYQMLSYLVPYLKVDKDCTDGSMGCFPPNVMYRYLAAAQGNYAMINNLPDRPKIRLIDGTLIQGSLVSSNCGTYWGPTNSLGNVCASYNVDINGNKGPNQFGKDTFTFLLTKFGVIPAGAQQQTAGQYFSNDCKDQNSARAFGCTAWIIQNENMDYLDCNNLDWNGPTKCN